MSTPEVTLAEALSRVSLAEALDHAQRILAQCDAFLRRLDMPAAPPLRTQCSWCFPPGSPGYDPTGSHGICQAHADQITLIEPLEIVISVLRGGAALGRDARLQLAESLQTLAARLDRLTIPRSS